MLTTMVTVIVKVEVELEVVENGDLKSVIAHGLAAGHRWIGAAPVPKRHGGPGSAERI